MSHSDENFDIRIMGIGFGGKAGHSGQRSKIRSCFRTYFFLTLPNLNSLTDLNVKMCMNDSVQSNCIYFYCWLTTGLVVAGGRVWCPPVSWCATPTWRRSGSVGRSPTSSTSCSSTPSLVSTSTVTFYFVLYFGGVMAWGRGFKSPYV